MKVIDGLDNKCLRGVMVRKLDKKWSQEITRANTGNSFKEFECTRERENGVVNEGANRIKRKLS